MACQRSVNAVLREPLASDFAAADPEGMNRKLKYPEVFNSILTIETGKFEMVAEIKEQRQLRLRLTSNARRAAAFGHRALNENRIEPLTLAWKEIYEGKSFPIHFDICHLSGRYTKIERYTLLHASFTKRVFEDGAIVGSLGANNFVNRSKAIPAHFTHRARIR